jgi:hypothetical protein
LGIHDIPAQLDHLHTGVWSSHLDFFAVMGGGGHAIESFLVSLVWGEELCFHDIPAQLDHLHTGEEGVCVAGERGLMAMLVDIALVIPMGVVMGVGTPAVGSLSSMWTTNKQPS